MKRLSVRLSAIGAVLVLGSAAIAYSVLSNRGEPAATEDDGKQVAQSRLDDKHELTPIQAEQQDGPVESPAENQLQPPPGMFGGRGDVRKANHLEPANDGDTDGGSMGIPPDPTGVGGGFRIPDSPASGGGSELPSAIPDTTSGDYPAGPSATSDPSVASNSDSAYPAPPDPMVGDLSSSTPSGTAAPPEPGSDRLPTVTGGPVADATTDPAFAASDSGMSFPETSLPETSLPETPSSDTSSAATATTSEPAAGGAVGEGGPPPVAPSYGGLGAPLADSPPAASPGAGAAPDSPTTALPENGYGTSPQSDGNAQPTGNVLGVAAGAGGVAAGAALADSPHTGSGFNSDPSGSNGNYPGTASGDVAASGAHPAAPAASSYVPGGYGAADRAVSSATAAAQGSSMGGGSSGYGEGPAALMASNVPGDHQLEGQQAPSIVIEKSAPEEIQVNRKATFQVRVRNNGNAPAHNVVVVDRVPNGTRFVDATPPVAPTADGTLIWQIDVVQPGEEVVLAMNVLPQTAGEIGSVAQATFQTFASVRTVCTRPELKLDVKVAEEILIGQPATLDITITNVGNGAAEKVVIEEDVPDGFTHAAGRELEHEIGTLQPQEAKRLSLVLDSAKPGTFQNHMTVRGEGNLFDEDVRPIRVISPQLQVAMQGPSLRYLDRQATYAVTLANPGTAAAKNVQLVTYLPKGMKYVTSDNQGQYDTQSHAVYWSLEELPVSKQGSVHVTVLPIEPGAHKLKSDVQADLGLKEACEHEVVVEGVAELAFVISDVADPIEVGSETTYEIKVHNRGSKADTNIQLVAELPPGVTPTSGDGPTQGTVQGQMVVFGPLARLGPNEEAVFKVHARGTASGDHVMRAQLRSGELRVPVTKEEITRVYADH